MTWRYPWDFVRHIERSRQGRSFGLSPDRKQFFIRGVRSASDLTQAEQEYIRDNRDRILQHVQHLLPPPEFKRQAARGFPGFDPPRDRRFTSETCADNGPSQDWQVDTSKVPF